MKVKTDYLKNEETVETEVIQVIVGSKRFDIEETDEGIKIRKSDMKSWTDAIHIIPEVSNVVQIK